VCLQTCLSDLLYAVDVELGGLAFGKLITKCGRLASLQTASDNSSVITDSYRKTTSESWSVIQLSSSTSAAERHLSKPLPRGRI